MLSSKSLKHLTELYKKSIDDNDHEDEDLADEEVRDAEVYRSTVRFRISSIFSEIEDDRAHDTTPRASFLYESSTKLSSLTQMLISTIRSLLSLPSTTTISPHDTFTSIGVTSVDVMIEIGGAYPYAIDGEKMLACETVNELATVMMEGAVKWESVESGLDGDGEQTTAISKKARYEMTEESGPLTPIQEGTFFE